MQFLVQSSTRPDADPAAFVPYLTAEAAVAWRLHLDGFIRQAYFAAPPAAPRAILVVEADNAAEVEDRLGAMPMRQAGLVSFEITPIGAFLPWTALFTGPEGAETSAATG